MSKIIQYEVVEFEPGWFEARVQYQGLIFKHWKSIGCHGDDRPFGYGSTEFSVRKCEQLIEEHKKRQTTPWEPRAVYRETL